MPSRSVPSDAELALVARVAGREGWTDLASPPAHGPRSIDEELAVARFRDAIPRSRRRRRGLTRLQGRIAVAALTVVVLGGCWMVSPSRTAVGIFGAALFTLVAFRRRRRAGVRPALR